MEQIIKNRLKETVVVIEKLDTDQIKNIAEKIIFAFKNKKRVYLFGNGGSAADANHLATEFCGKYLIDRDPLPAISLSTNISTITAIANDYSYNDIFKRQLEAFAEPDDIAIGISTSGNSSNVLKAIETAKKIGMVSIAFTGCEGKLKDAADYSLIIPSKNVPVIQEGYMVAGHIICSLVESSLFGD